jgi:hypothetical protein
MMKQMEEENYIIVKWAQEVVDIFYNPPNKKTIIYIYRI